MKLEVLEITDLDDGTARIMIDTDYESILTFAKIGIIKALTDSLEESDEYHSEAEKGT